MEDTDSDFAGFPDLMDPEFNPEDQDEDDHEIQLERTAGQITEDFADISDKDPEYLPEDEAEDSNGHEEPPVRMRKRLRRTNDWKRNLAKNKRNSGNQYLNTSGEQKNARTVRSLPNHKCRYACLSFQEVERNAIFEEFWALGSWNLQTSFLVSCMEPSSPKRKRNAAGSNKNISVSLKMQGKRVCKLFFRSTLDISQKRYDNVLKKMHETRISDTDKRGKHVPANKMPQECVDQVKGHIESFPRYASHYSRQQNIQTKYLNPDLNVRKMYDLYCDSCREKQQVPVKESFYRHIFTTQFNLRFKAPHTDTCRTCDSLENKMKYIEDPVQIEESKKEKDKHMADVERAKSSKEQARQLAKDNPTSVTAICFDLEKTLPTPVLTTSVVYYSRVLWTYNLGVHNLGNQQASMFMWHEGEAYRGSQEIGSCLLKYVQGLPATTKHLIAFSDNCGGQNKNQNIVRFWMYIVRFTHIEKVDHKFLVSGHSYMECDQDFGLIEKEKNKTQYVFVPNDWVNIVTKTSKKFSVFRMEKEHFRSIGKMQQFVSQSAIKGIRGMQWLHFEKDTPFTLFFKNSLDDETCFETLDLKLSKPGRPSAPSVLKLDPLYRDAVPIKTAKHKDLMKLLDYLPPVHHPFYKTLKHTSEKKQKSDDLVGNEKLTDCESE